MTVRIDKKLAELSKLTSDNSKYATGCIHFQETESGYIVQATNGKLGVMVTGGDQIEKGSFNGKDVLLSADDWRKAANQKGGHYG